jgi:SAM-dependent methyltransferase
MQRPIVQLESCPRVSEPEPTRGPSPVAAIGTSHGHSRKTLFAHLDQIAEEFPAAVRQRGIHRNWNAYRYALTQLSGLMESLASSPGKYLDLGSGAGVIPLVMAKAGLQVSVMDTWSEYAEEADNLMGNFAQFAARFNKHGVQWTKHDIAQTPLPFSSDSFDLITLFDVFEHLPAPRNVLEEIHRLLRPGGLLLVTLPNVANLRNRLRLMLGRSPHADSIKTWFEPVFFGHYREMTMHEMKETLSRFGFSVVASKYTEAMHWNTRCPDGRWGKYYRLNSMHQMAKLLYLSAASAIPSFRFQLFVAGRKKGE